MIIDTNRVYQSFEPEFGFNLFIGQQVREQGIGS